MNPGSPSAARTAPEDCNLLGANIVPQQPAFFGNGQCHCPAIHTDTNSGGEIDIGTLNTNVASDSTMGTPMDMLPTSSTIVNQPSLSQDMSCTWDIEHDSYWSSFSCLLDANDIDLDGLDLAILNATGDSLQRGAMQADSTIDDTNTYQAETENALESSATSYSMSSVQRSWHTYCAHESSEHSTPEPSPEQYHVDEACHTNLSHRLQPRLQHGILPSIKFLVRHEVHSRPFTPLLLLSHADL